MQRSVFERAERSCLLLRSVCGGLLLALLLTGCGSEDAAPSRMQAAAVAANGFEPTPDADPFYAPPSMVPDEPGKLLGFQAITYQPAGVVLPNPTWLIQYATRDASGRPVAAIATVIKPTVPSVIGKSVLVSFQQPYDSLGAQCTPSKTAQGSTANQSNMVETLEFMPGLQTLGWTMVIPDYEGLNHAWGANRLQGQATLDAIRAAQQFEPLNLTQNTPVALWGYSGGAWASTWAAALQPKYAPELNLVGTVAGGTPVEFLNLMKAVEGRSSFNFLFSALVGISREYPKLLAPDTLTPKGLAVKAQLKDACVGQPKDGSSIPAASLTDYVLGDAPYTRSEFVEVDRANTLLYQDFAPTSEVYMYHEIHDELVLVEGADNLAKHWCQRGVPLNYYRNNTPAEAGNPILGIHLAGAALGTPPSIAYIQARLSGAPLAPTPPGTVRCN